MLKINGVKMKVTPKVQVELSDIGEALQNARGDIVRDRIATKRILSIDFPALSEEQMKEILGLTSQEFFDVEYADPELGTVTKIFYVESKSAPFFTADRDGKSYWSGLSFTMKER